MRDSFVDPDTKQVLDRTPEGDYRCTRNGRTITYVCHDGCCDFVGDDRTVQNKRHIYDDVYARSAGGPITLTQVTEAWQDPTVPWRKTMLESLGDLSGKTVLLLGNGSSYKEFYFLLLGAHLVFTDLSLEAVRRAQDAFRRSEFFIRYEGMVKFHAVDAMRMPFPDESFDVIYGAKCVGFFDDKALFFREARRCLKAQGICRFADDAISPVFEFVKTTTLRPLQKLLYRSLSAHDHVRSGGMGGFSERDVVPVLEQQSFRNIMWIRQHFFLRIAQLVYGKYVKWDPKRIRSAERWFLVIRRLDERCEKTRWLQKNALALTWGCDK